eukprot:3941901-Ditylum_brightwellii.AAC.1
MKSKSDLDFSSFTEEELSAIKAAAQAAQTIPVDGSATAITSTSTCTSVTTPKSLGTTQTTFASYHQHYTPVENNLLYNCETPSQSFFLRIAHQFGIALNGDAALRRLCSKEPTNRPVFLITELNRKKSPVLSMVHGLHLHPDSLLHHSEWD